MRHPRSVAPFPHPLVLAGMLALLALLASACGNDDRGARVPLDQAASQSGGSAAGGTLAPEAREALTRGNEAFRARKYDEALTAYRAASAAAPNDAAPWYGIQMAARALGRTALADTAVERIKALSPGSAAGGAEDPHALPPDHPRIKVTEDVGKKPKS